MIKRMFLKLYKWLTGYDVNDYHWILKGVYRDGNGWVLTVDTRKGIKEFKITDDKYLLGLVPITDRCVEFPGLTKCSRQDCERLIRLYKLAERLGWIK